MLRLLFDENFDHRIVRGLRLRLTQLDYLTVQATKLQGLKDPPLLAWAAEQRRIIVTHDVNTLPKYAYERVRAGEAVAGVIIVPDELAIGIAIEELALLIGCCATEDFVNQIIYVPI